MEEHKISAEPDLSLSRFKIGDLVVLVSGSPAMTVEKIHVAVGAYYYDCTFWARNNGKFVNGRFSEAVLRPTRRQTA